MALRLLLVDPDGEWLAHGKNFFKEKGYEVSVADTGKSAQLQLYNASDEKKPFFYVVLNLHVQNHTGMQVMKFIKSKHPTQSVCIVVEDQESMEQLSTEYLMRLGAQEAMCKPFEFDDLLATLEGHQSLGQLLSTIKKNEGISDEEEVDMQDDSFTSVPIDEFYPNKTILFNVYIKLNTNKYLKIIHAGDSFHKERLTKYKEEKKVTHLYFHSRDRKKYIRFCNHLAAKFVKANVEGSSRIKVGILKATAEKFLEEVGTEGLKPQVLEQGKEIVNNIYNMIDTDKDLHALMKDYHDFDPSAFTHAYLVCLFSSMIVSEFDWQSKATVETVAMASLFHDIGMMALPKELLELTPDEMTEEQLEMYKKHPEMGAKIVNDNKMITNSVKQVIYQHHERSDGTGFPDGIKDQKILTLSKIISVSDSFAEYIIENEVTPIVALRKVLTNPEQVKKFNGVVLEKFMKIFVDPGKKSKNTQLQSNSKVVNKKAS